MGSGPGGRARVVGRHFMPLLNHFLSFCDLFLCPFFAVFSAFLLFLVQLRGVLWAVFGHLFDFFGIFLGFCGAPP